MRSPLALITVMSAVVFGCGETTTEGSGPAAVGGASDGPSKTSATGGKSATGDKTGSGGTATKTSARRSDPSGGAGARSSATGSGGKSSAGTQTNGGEDSEPGGASAAPTGGRTGGISKPAGGGKSTAGGASAGGQTTGGKPTAGGASAGGQATGGKSPGSNAGGQAAGGKTSDTTATGGKAAGGDTGAATGKSAGCGKAPGITQYNKGEPISITAGGKQRRYILNVPTNYDNNHPYRLIVVYHQLDGNDKQMVNWQYYGLQPLSDNSTIFVAPNGQKNGSPCSGTGNGDSGCGWPNSGDSDLALADAVVAQVEENFCVDTTRIFATGWSYGGSMSYRTACSRPQGGTASWGVRGIAIYAAAQLSGNCTPSKPVAFYHAHGTRDSVLNYDSMGLPLAQNFAKANGCTWATPTKVTSGNHVCTNMTGCTAGYPLEFCSFNGDHTPFPDNGQAQGSWGPQEAWKFLSQF
ncbi:MAG TPA: hypothetical protein VKP30_10035 [Polyangiaceae bacterium]|nr:hypothetical protein [Polyangiaceae bacterium]